MSPDLFLSYSRNDRAELATRLRNALARGAPRYTSWLDATDIRIGSPSWADIDEAIKSCRCFVYIMTPDSVSNDCFCRNEVIRAFRY